VVQIDHIGLRTDIAYKPNEVAIDRGNNLRPGYWAKAKNGDYENVYVMFHMIKIITSRHFSFHAHG
jgi:hypothetical protein